MKNQPILTQRLKPHKKWPGLAIFWVFAISFHSPCQAVKPNPIFTENALATATSLYLVMHAKDPVFWQPWHLGVLEEAQRLHKPILISSGYFSCHWCHVMQRENYQDKAVAKLLNQHFISVKIDRELLPDTDQALIEFSRKSAGHAGWPQHIILTPEGHPFYAFVYLPKATLVARLERVIDLWQSNPEHIRQLAKKALPTPSDSNPKTLILDDDLFIQAFNQQLLQQIDELSGGLKTSHKFPKPHLLITLLQQTNPPQALQAWLKLTLDQMQNQGLHDAVHGGFFRYTIDPEWQSPHFEKMLYTQALLAKVYFVAADQFANPQYLQTARQTLDYVETHLWDANAQLFMSSQSAIDFQQREGGAYLWSRQALKKRLNPQAFQYLVTAWQLQQPPPFELGWLPKPTAKHWSDIQIKLRRTPTDIPTDDKMILAWNALMLSSYAVAYKLDTANRSQYANKAEQLVKSLQKAFQNQSPPRAFNRQGQIMGSATLEDYALTLQALKDWQNTLSQSPPLAPQSKVIQTLKMLQAQLKAQSEQRFLSAQGWRLSQAPILPGQHHHWATPDSDLPSVTARLDCSRPNHIAHEQTELLTHPLDYASYADTLKCLKQEAR